MQQTSSTAVKVTLPSLYTNPKSVLAVTKTHPYKPRGKNSFQKVMKVDEMKLKFVRVASALSRIQMTCMGKKKKKICIFGFIFQPSVVPYKIYKKIFVLSDTVVPQDPKALSIYIDICVL